MGLLNTITWFLCVSPVQVVEKMKPEEKVRWSWKLVFKRVASDLANSVEHEIRTCMATSIEAELARWETTHALEVEQVPDSLVGGRLDYPRIVSRVP